MICLQLYKFKIINLLAKRVVFGPLNAFKMSYSIIHMNAFNVLKRYSLIIWMARCKYIGLFLRQKNARTRRAVTLFASGLFRFPGHLRQEVIAFLQIGRGIFPQLFRNVWLLRVKTAEALLLHQRLRERIRRRT